MKQWSKSKRSGTSKRRYLPCAPCSQLSFAVPKTHLRCTTSSKLGDWDQRDRWTSKTPQMRWLLGSFRIEVFDGEGIFFCTRLTNFVWRWNTTAACGGWQRAPLLYSAQSQGDRGNRGVAICYIWRNKLHFQNDYFNYFQLQVLFLSSFGLLFCRNVYIRYADSLVSHGCQLLHRFAIILSEKLAFLRF